MSSVSNLPASKLSVNSVDNPPLTRSKTSPGLDNIYCKFDKEVNSGNSEESCRMNAIKSAESSQEDLLESLSRKQSDEYRFIKFNVPAYHLLSTKKNYEKRVSFDTIDIQYQQHTKFFEEEMFKSNIDDYSFSLYDNSRGRDRDRSPSPSSQSPLHSPASSPARMLSPLRSSRFLSPSYRPCYPTRPIITHKGCTFTKIHKSFEDLYLGKLYNKENGWLKPVLPQRVILVYISGRKHTWVALDWILRRFIEHGDSVIVVSAVNSIDLNQRRSSSYRSPQRIVAKTPKMRMRQRNRPEYVKCIAKNIMTYMMEIINPNIIAKISIELAVGKTKDVLKEMYKLYEPNLVCAGTKPNLRISAPLRSWLSSKLTDRLVKNFSIPVIVVPAMNMNEFEEDLEMEINNKFINLSLNSQPMSSLSDDSVDLTSNVLSVSSDENRFNSLSSEAISSEPVSSNLLSPEDNTKEIVSDTASSIYSDSSEGSVSSEESYSSYDEISKLYTDYKRDISNKLKELDPKQNEENYFADHLKLISDRSLNLCQELRSIDPDFRGKGAKLARAITGSNSFGVVPFKTKSLLAPIEKIKTDGASSSGLSYKEVKRNLKLNSLKNQHPPQIAITSASVSPPKQTSLKFVNLETPSGIKPERAKSLKKSLSHDIDSSSKRPTLEPLKSHPDITSNLDSFKDDSEDNIDASRKKKKSKSKSFWKLFK